MTTRRDPKEMEERLDELADGIEAARRQAHDHGTLPDPDPDPTFIDPDADGRIDDEDEHPGTSFAT